MIDIKSQIIKPALGLEDMRVVASAEGWGLMDIQSLGFFNKRNFRYRRVITITEQSGSSLIDYQVLIELNSTNFNFSHTRSDGGDIRFTDTAGNLLPYWIESYDASAQTAKIFVKVPSLPANATIVIYMYYGNSSVFSESDGEATFEFFDDFENPIIGDFATVTDDSYVKVDGEIRAPEGTADWHNRFKVIHYEGSHDRTYIVYGGENSHPMITYYDHDTDTFATPIRISTHGKTDDCHSHPALAIDDDGYLYVFWGAHVSTLYMVKSLNPEDITSWDTEKTLSGSITYPQVFFIGDTMYLFYRNGNDWVYRTSTDYQTDWTWSSETVVIDEGSYTPYPLCVRGSESPTPTIHVAWLIWDGTYKRDVYYAYRDTDGTWKKRDGTALTLPLSESNADKVYDYNYIAGWINDIQLDENNDPYIIFLERDSDAIPTRLRLAKYESGSWMVRTITSDVKRGNMGCLRIENSTLLKVYAAVGGDPDNTRYGGEIQEFTSSNGGNSWIKTRDITHDSPTLHSVPLVALEQDSMKRVSNNKIWLVWCSGLSYLGKIHAWGPGLNKTTVMLDGKKWYVTRLKPFGAPPGDYSISDSEVKLDRCSIASRTFQINDGIIEYRARATSGYEISSVVRSETNLGDTLTNSGSQGYHASSFSNWENCIYIGGQGKVANTANAITGNTNYCFRFIVSGVQLTGKRFSDSFDSEEASVSYTDTGGRTNGYVGLRVDGDAPNERVSYFDWVRVRKYADPEPLVSIGSENVRISFSSYPEGAKIEVLK